MAKTIHRIFVPFQDGTRKLIEFGPNAFVAVEETLGIESVIEYIRNLATDLGKQTKVPGFRSLRAFMWAGVNAAGGEYTLEQIGNQLDMGKIGETWKEILRAISLTLTGSPDAPEAPEVPEEEEKEPGEDPTKDAAAPTATDGTGEA